MQDEDHERGNSKGPRLSIALMVPKRLVKKIKDCLEAHGNLDKSVKIRPATLEEQEIHLEEVSIEPRTETFFIPCKLCVRAEQVDLKTSINKADLLQSLGLLEFENDIEIAAFKQTDASHSFLWSERGRKHDSSPHNASMNPLASTIGHWLHQLPPKPYNWTFAGEEVLSYSWTYMIYPPLLLLPPSTMSNLTSIFSLEGQDLTPDLFSLWRLLSKNFKTSHVALNAPIPASASKVVSIEGSRHPEANFLRSPTGLVPLYGDFGPTVPLSRIPTVTDFSSAFWCTVRQNGIFQTWSPRYTMFSRGNISEKRRIISLLALTEIQLGTQPEEASAVDLYAGIGYFAFSYAKARIGKVLCWEINPWSVEGLRRGAERNNWGIKVINDGQTLDTTMHKEERLIVFQESNEHAASRIAVIKDSIFSIRHVNCGLLPSSKDSWEVAVQILDPMGGWIHAHENIAQADIESRREEVVEIFTRLVRRFRGLGLEVQWEVKCEHVEQVKSYAPGVVHCVLDISIVLTQ